MADRRQRRAPLQDGGVVVSRLAVGAEGRRVLCGAGRVLQHSVSVSGRLGVVCEPRPIRGHVRSAGKRRERTTMQRDAGERRKRLLDRPARELVPEEDSLGPGT